MKRCIWILLLLQIQLLSFAQTKPKRTLDETVNWIVEKFNAHSGMYSACYENKALYIENEFHLSYNANNKQIEINYTRFYPLTFKSDSLIAKIPIESINKIEYRKEKICPDVPSRDNEYIKFSSYGKDIITNNSVNNNIIIPINIDEESNLLIRLQKAFADLKSHFPKKEEAY